MAGQSGFSQQIDRYFERFTEIPSDVMAEIREIIDSSIQENFSVGGRYGTDNEMGGGTERWEPSQRVKREGGQTLLVEARMRKEARVRVDDDSIVIGSGVIYGGIHHVGGTIKHPGGTPYAMIGGRATFLRKDGGYPQGTKFTAAHDIPIPARPWAVVQNDDLEEINDVVVEHYKTITK